MNEILHRSTDTFDLSGDGRTIEGLAVPWEVFSPVVDLDGSRYFEAFIRSSVTATLKVRGPVRPVFVRHEYLKGSFGEVEFIPSAEGLMFRARAADTRFAAETLPEVGPHGALSAVSIGFRAIRPRAIPKPAPGSRVLRTEIALEELSLAEVGQHRDAKVLAVRAVDAPRRADLTRRLRALPKN